MSVGRLYGLTAIVLAYIILLALVSPVVPSPMTTVRSKQVVVPPQGAAPVTVLLFTSVVMHSLWLMEEPEHLLTSGSDVVDLTTARLC
jgi:hypothetical protein